MMQSAAVIPDNFNSTVYEALESADNVILFQWDLTDDTFRLRDTTRRHRYALPSFFSRASTQLAIGGLIHPDDAGMLEHYLHRIYHKRRQERKPQNLSVRLRLRSNKKPLWLWSEVHLVTFYQGQRPMSAFGNIRNIQAEKLWQERINHRANTDALTGLLSKSTAQLRIRSAIRKMVPETGTASLLIVDADEFKTVNDTFGHLFGDKVLHAIGQAIRQNFRQGDIKGRIGGDEFIVFLPGMSNADVLIRHCQGLCRRLARVFHQNGQHHNFSISIGAAQYPLHGQSYEELFAKADMAPYEAKRRGKGQSVLYRQDMANAQENPVAATSTRRQPVRDIAALQTRIDEMQNTITTLEGMLCALLEAKK